MRLLIGGLLFLFLCSDVSAFCFREAGERYGIDPLILYSISQVESGMRAEAVNYNKTSYDYGLMQINTFWYPIIGRDLWMSLSDPCTNVMVGAWILAGCKMRYKDIWQAVGCYHSPDPERGKRYAERVKKIYYKAKAKRK